MKKVLIKKLENDALADRISAGGTLKDGYYLVYRGNIKDIRDILSEILLVTQDYQEMPIGVSVLAGRVPAQSVPKAKVTGTEKNGICRKCGCSWDHPCTIGKDSLCHWVDKSQTLCSKCFGQDASTMPSLGGL